MNKCYSPATKNEFDSARANNKKILIFIRSDSDRDPKLRDFISDIQDPKTGIITSSYRNIFESKISKCSC